MQNRKQILVAVCTQELDLSQKILQGRVTVSKLTLTKAKASKLAVEFQSALFDKKHNADVENALRVEDLTNAIGLCFQSARHFWTRLVPTSDLEDKRDYVIQQEIGPAPRTAADIEQLYYNDLSPFGVGISCSFYLLQAVTREALQARVFLAVYPHMKEYFDKHPEATIECQTDKTHKDAPWSAKTIEITKDIVDDVLPLVAAAVIARYEHTEHALATRSKSKRATKDATVKISAPQVIKYRKYDEMDASDAEDAEETSS